MKETRRDKILDVAVGLAASGGFDSVRQREVAASAGVALGTLYKTFRSKEDILSAAIERDAAELERRMEKRSARGKTPVDRMVSFFAQMTRSLCRRPNYARAVLRAMASGEPEVARNVAAYQGRMNGLIVAALRGVGRLAPGERASHDELVLSQLMQSLWYAFLVGWSAGLYPESQIVSHVRTAAELLVSGMQARAARPSKPSERPRRALRRARVLAVPPEEPSR
jgi:AcrR family transcriptional regulator